MNCIIYNNTNDCVTVLHPGTGYTIEWVLQNDFVKMPDSMGATPSVVDNDSLPWADEDFFDAWKIVDSVVTVRIDKAKQITKTRLRKEREPLLTAQDVAFQRALETGADTAPIIAEKQRLRDITNLADTCVTLDELRALHC
jgi:hypothetical protein